MKRYFLFILNRLLSGVVNGLFYMGSRLVWPFLVLLIGLTLYQLISNLIPVWDEMNKLSKVLAIAGIIGSVLSLIFLGISFKFPNSKLTEIHLWTFSHQTTLSGTYFVTGKKWWKNIWWLMLTISPSSFFQKLFINLLGGAKWNYSGTDDPLGKVWSMKLFGKVIKVPRVGNMKVRLILTIISIILFLVVNKIINDYKIQIPMV